jgi:hypothetical protein
MWIKWPVTDGPFLISMLFDRIALADTDQAIRANRGGQITKESGRSSVHSSSWDRSSPGGFRLRDIDGHSLYNWFANGVAHEVHTIGKISLDQARAFIDWRMPVNPDKGQARQACPERRAATERGPLSFAPFLPLAALCHAMEGDVHLHPDHSCKENFRLVTWPFKKSRKATTSNDWQEWHKSNRQSKPH